jgi:cell fate regulator YaaT (PSP1 superfamily)
MGCGTCSTGNGCGTGGCKSGGCATGGCNKLNTFDWFSQMLPPDVSRQETLHEVRFKSSHKGFYKNVNGLDLLTGDLVAVEAERGYDVGTISLSGELTRLQMRKKRVSEDKLLKIYRKATPEDLEKLKTARSRELDLLQRSRIIIRRMKLEMKLSEVEVQGDNTKTTFYYTADSRVDFRELIKVLAEEFRLRIEMKQIGLRQEAGILGGIGSCGRELCCSTWLTDFKNVSTAAARYQNISLNPMKISGQCGRLKCCLNYELETYMDALKGIPEVHSVETELGIARLQKTDIFKKKMWFAYGDGSDWHGVDVSRVKELVALNKKGIKPPSLLSSEEIIAQEEETRREKAMDFVDVVGQSRINERPLNTNKKKKKKKSPGAQVEPTDGSRPATPRPPRPDHPQGNRPPRAENTPNNRPTRTENTQGNRPPRSNNAQTNRPPRTENPPNSQGQRTGVPQGNRPPRTENPQNNRPPRTENPANPPAQKAENTQGNRPARQDFQKSNRPPRTDSQPGNRPPRADGPNNNPNSTANPNNQEGNQRPNQPRTAGNRPPRQNPTQQHERPRPPRQNGDNRPAPNADSSTAKPEN